jgi:hypothetical protein
MLQQLQQTFSNCLMTLNGGQMRLEIEYQLIKISKIWIRLVQEVQKIKFNKSVIRAIIMNFIGEA